MILISKNACGSINKVVEWYYYSILAIDCSFSGGKDSTYNMIQCVRHGHEIVALANLHPKKDIGRKDFVIITSYSFQFFLW